MLNEFVMAEEQGTPGYLWQTLAKDAKLAAELDRRALRESVQGLINEEPERAIRYLQVKISADGWITVSVSNSIRT